MSIPPPLPPAHGNSGAPGQGHPAQNRYPWGPASDQYITNGPYGVEVSAVYDNENREFHPSPYQAPQGTVGSAPGLPAHAPDGRPIAVLRTPQGAEFNQPVLFTNDASFTGRNAQIKVVKNLHIEGELVIHGKLVVDGSSRIGGPPAHFDQPYRAPEGIWNHKISIPEEDTLMIAQRWMPMGDSYVFHEDLTAQGKDKVVVIKTQLVIVTGNFETEGPARFHGEVVFRGGVRFRETPNGVNAGAQSGQNGIN